MGVYTDVSDRVDNANSARCPHSPTACPPPTPDTVLVSLTMPSGPDALRLPNQFLRGLPDPPGRAHSATATHYPAVLQCVTKQAVDCDSMRDPTAFHHDVGALVLYATSNGEDECEQSERGSDCLRELACLFDRYEHGEPLLLG